MPESTPLTSPNNQTTNSEAENIRNAATVGFIQSKQTLQIMSERLQKLKDEIYQVGSGFPNHSADMLATMQFNDFPWWNPDVIKQAAQDVLKAHEEVEKARIRAQQLGAIIPS